MAAAAAAAAAAVVVVVVVVVRIDLVPIDRSTQVDVDGFKDRAHLLVTL